MFGGGGGNPSSDPPGPSLTLPTTLLVWPLEWVTVTSTVCLTFDSVGLEGTLTKPSQMVLPRLAAEVWASTELGPGLPLGRRETARTELTVTPRALILTRTETLPPEPDSRFGLILALLIFTPSALAASARCVTLIAAPTTRAATRPAARMKAGLKASRVFLIRAFLSILGRGKPTTSAVQVIRRLKGSFLLPNLPARQSSEWTPDSRRATVVRGIIAADGTSVRPAPTAIIAYWRHDLARAIAALTAVVVLSIGGVLVHLWLQRPADRPAAAAPRALITTEPDGTVYDLDLKIEQLEQQLLDGETRAELLAEQVGQLQDAQRNQTEMIQQLGEDLDLLTEQLIYLLPAFPEDGDGEASAGAETPPP